MSPKFFSKQEDFRRWLEKNHLNKTELVVGFYKVSSGKPSMTWTESVDQALCFGWIDGIRKSIDDISYTIRFTPRRQSSNWSKINIEKISALKKAGLMKKRGLEVFEKRDLRKIIFIPLRRNQLVSIQNIQTNLKQTKKRSNFMINNLHLIRKSPFTGS